MCCETHDLRSFVLKYHEQDEHLAGADNRRCRCTELGKWSGQACVMEADGEDLLCAWCRSTDHMRWYEQVLRLSDPAVAAYYAQRGGSGYASAYPAGAMKLYRRPVRERGGFRGPSPMEEFRDEYAKWSAEERVQLPPGEVTIGGTDWDAAARLDDAVQRGLKDSGYDVSGNGYTVAGYTAPGPDLPEGARWTDYTYSTGWRPGPSPFEFTPDEVAEMRAFSRVQPLTTEPLKFQAEDGMTTEQVMKYLMNKYGGSIGP